MDSQQTERLRALWKSGRDKYLSFFSVLEEVRREVGDSALPAWCIDNLRISISIIAETKKVLQKTDAEVVKRNLSIAAAAEKAQARKVREDAALAKELEKQERAKRLVEARAETERAKTELERARADTKKEKNAEKRRQRQSTPNQRAKRQRRNLTLNISDAGLPALVNRFIAAERMCQHANDEWIEGSIAKAIILFTARNKFPSDQEFGFWLNTNNISTSNQDRAALINLGRLEESKLREILVSTQSRSYRLIWEENKQPALKLVEGPF